VKEVNKKLTKQEVDKLKNILEYLQDKVEDCYRKETEQVIKEYLKSL